ncbi:hypothetical protein BST61_g6717 [Cercospora zeina]
MGSIGLPPKDSSEIYLTTATPAECEELSRGNSAEWKAALELESYLRREKHLADQDLTRDGGLTTWVLVWQPCSAADRHVLTGCETIKKRALVSRDGTVDETVCHGVGSVFCPPEYRGRGYTGRMISELGDILKTWQMENDKEHLISALWSDIGKQFYATRGWHPYASLHITLPATERPLGAGVHLLKSQDLGQVCAIDEKLMRNRLHARSTNGRITVSFLPDHQTVAWHHAREDFVSKEVLGKSPTVRGARVGSVWAYWTRVWADPHGHELNTLHILRIVIEDERLGADFSPASSAGVEAINAAAEGRMQLPGLECSKVAETKQSIATILALAQTEAERWGMKEVMLWNPTSLTLAAARQIDRDVSAVERQSESIPSLRWYGDGSWENIDWVENMKYAWC